MSRTLSGLFLVGAFKREKKSREKGNPRLRIRIATKLNSDHSHPKSPETKLDASFLLTIEAFSLTVRGPKKSGRFLETLFAGAL